MASSIAFLTSESFPHRLGPRCGRVRVDIQVLDGAVFGPDVEDVARAKDHLGKLLDEAKKHHQKEAP